MPESATRAHRAAKRYIYAWGEGRAEGHGKMKDLLGGKGAGLAEMTLAGLPTPPGFTITTEACNDYFAAGKTLPDGPLGRRAGGGQDRRAPDGQGLRRPANPLLVSVRSGAKFSMPGMMDTVLNLGLNEETLRGLIALTGNERFGWDAYRRFIAMFGRIVMDVDGARFDEPLEAAKAAHGPGAKDTDLDVADLKALVAEFKKAVRARRAATSRPIPTSSSISRSRPSSPRGSASAPTTTGTARRSPTTSARPSTSSRWCSATWGTTRAPASPSRATRTPARRRSTGSTWSTPRARTSWPASGRPPRSAQLADEMPAVYAEFQRIADQLELHYRNVQDLEFTIERGRLYMLQTRDAKRTAAAAVKIATRHGRRGRHLQAGGGRPDRARPGGPAPARPVRPRRAQARQAHRSRA